MPLTRTEALKVALSFPDASEGPYFNKPAVFVGETFLTRVHTKEDAMVLAIGSMEMRDMMLEAEPKLFYITDHYRKFPFVLVRLSVLTAKTLKEMLVGRAAQLAAMPPIKRRPKKTVKKKTTPQKAACWQRLRRQCPNSRVLRRSTPGRCRSRATAGR